MTVDIQHAQSGGFAPSAKQVQLWADTTHKWLSDQDNARQQDEVCLRIVDPTEMTALNRDYRGKQGVTNVLAFPANVPEYTESSLLGDIVICAERVAEEAEEQGKAALAHWAHLFIHGLLHLAGYDHNSDDEAAIMEAAETDLLAQLDIAAPYQEQNV